MSLWEKASLQVDLDSLRADFNSIRNRFPPHMVSRGYGGWSVTSSTGSYTDGWLIPGVTLVDNVKPDMSVEDYQKFQKVSGLPKRVIEYNKPTEICTPGLLKLIDSWKELGLNPCRVRFGVMKPKWAVEWHQDAPDSIYSVRLHVAIETSPEAVLESKTEKVHIPADGSVWFLQVNRPHRASNPGLTERVHLIANIFDTKEVSLNHRFTGWGSRA